MQQMLQNQPWGVRFFVDVELILKIGKNDHGALVGLTTVKGTRVRKKVAKREARADRHRMLLVSQNGATLVGLTFVKGTRVVKGKS